MTSGCLERTAAQASGKLAELIAREYVKSKALSIVRIFLPSVYPQAQQIEMLFDIEMRAANAAQAQIQADLRRLRSFNWTTEAERQRNLLIINNDEDTLNKWNREAREEAKRGTNWTHNWNGNPSHEFHPGPAYDQLKNISSLNWLK